MAREEIDIINELSALADRCPIPIRIRIKEIIVELSDCFIQLNQKQIKLIEDNIELNELMGVKG